MHFLSSFLGKNFSQSEMPRMYSLSSVSFPPLVPYSLLSKVRTWDVIIAACSEAVNAADRNSPLSHARRRLVS